jgi:NADPH2:quinone reductase
MGARVIACASSASKLAACSELGADWLIDYTSENLKTAIAEKTGRKDVDVIYDPVGGDYSEKAFRCIAPGGRHLVLGFTAGNIPSIALNRRQYPEHCAEPAAGQGSVDHRRILEFLDCALP